MGAALGGFVGFGVTVGLVWVLPIVIAANIGKHKNRPGLYWLGILLGWLGVLIAVCVGEGAGANPRKCPQCLATIPGEAVRCRHCGGDVQPVVTLHP